MVGYQQNAVEAGYKMVTPTFVNVGGSEYNIDDFQVIGVDDTKANIQVMNAEGQWTGMYYWYNAYTDGDTTLPAGWFDFDGLVPADVSLKPGDAVFFNTSVEGVKMQSSGQVAGIITNEVSAGYSMIGNASPVSIDVDSMKVIGVEDTKANIQVMNAAGQWTGMYYWYNEFVDGDTIYPAGWFDFDGLVPAGVTLQPGDSIFFNTSTEGVKVTIPSAL